ncbi:MAG: hypothetical protein M1833_001451 [Piccolia ochrophora]|nr:MAG: hypothetical protein M1833_001451 [Piccolia ochrophora]
MGHPDVPESTMLGIAWTGTSIALLLTVARLWIRRVSFCRFYWDDAWHILALLLLISVVSIYTKSIGLLYEVADFVKGSGPLSISLIERLPTFIQYQYSAYFLFLGCVYSVKLSFLVFYRRFFDGLTKLMYAWWVVLAVTGAAFLGCIGIFITTCGSPTDFFRLVLTVTVDVATDLMIMALPIRVLWRSTINKQQKTALAGIFSLATIIVAFAIVRAVVTSSTLTPSKASSLGQADPVPMTLYTILECIIAVIVSCLPSFRVLFVHRNTRRGQSSNQVGSGSGSKDSPGSVGSQDGPSAFYPPRTATMRAFKSLSALESQSSADGLHPTTENSEKLRLGRGSWVSLLPPILAGPPLKAIIYPR